MGILALEVYYRYSPMYREVVDKQLMAYGDALTAYGDFIRLHKAEKPEAAAAADKAREAVHAFLEASKPVETKPQEKALLARRGKAAMMLLNLDKAEGKLQEVISGLDTIQTRFPGCIDEPTRRLQLAQAWLALSRQLTHDGKSTPAREAEDKAIELYHELTVNAAKPDPQIQRWLAQCYMDRKAWHEALRIYRALAAPLLKRKLKPKSKEEMAARALFYRIVQCYTEIESYGEAEEWLQRIERIEGPNLAMLRRRAGLLEKQKRFPEARSLYTGALERLERYSAEWWTTWVAELEAAYREGDTSYVVQRIARMEVLHPDFGSQERRHAVLALRRRAMTRK